MEEEIREEPFAAVVNTELIKQICSKCFSSPDKTMRCSNCKFVHYCNPACQKSDWLMHKFECQSLLRVQPNIPTEFVRFLGRIIWTMRGSPHTSQNTPYRTFDQLMSHENEVKNDPQRQENLIRACSVLKEYFGDQHILPNPTQLIRIYGKIVTNSFTVCDSDLNSIGTALYLRLSLLDHSCCPNACIVFDGCTSILRPLQSNLSLSDLSKVSISYIELMSTKFERRRQLKEQYYFECLCERCSNENDQKDKSMLSCVCDSNECKCDVTQQMQAAQWKTVELDKIKKTGDFTEIREIVTNALSEYTSLGPLNVYRVRLLEYALDACIELEVWEDALRYANLILPAYRLYYPSTHPSLTLHLMKLAKLLLVNKQTEEATPILEEAERICASSFGRSHHLHREINGTLTGLRSELAIAIDRNMIAACD